MWSEAGWLYAACNATTMPYMHAVPLISIHVNSRTVEHSHTQLFLFLFDRNFSENGSQVTSVTRSLVSALIIVKLVIAIHSEMCQFHYRCHLNNSNLVLEVFYWFLVIFVMLEKGNCIEK